MSKLPWGDHWVVEGILAGGMVQVWAVQPRACVVWETPCAGLA